MIPKECKRLADVDFPIAVVSTHSAREKSIRHGHPSVLHLWWGLWPLAVSGEMPTTASLPTALRSFCGESETPRGGPA